MITIEDATTTKKPRGLPSLLQSEVKGNLRKKPLEEESFGHTPQFFAAIK